MASAPDNKIDLKAIKALSKEQRQALAFDIRKDQDLWNAVNGMGGLSEDSKKSLLQGTITEKGIPINRAKITVSIKEEIVAEGYTNPLGYYKIDLEPEDYTVKVSNGEEVSPTSNLQAKKGETSTFDYDFEEEKAKL